MQYLTVRQGGEDDSVPVAQREVLAIIEEQGLLRTLKELTTSGRFAGDTCRCPGDLTLALHGASGDIVGSATIHSERISWERNRFQNDLITPQIYKIQLLFSKLGINGTSRILLDQMISRLNLHEGESQFRRSGDESALLARRVPLPLLGDLLNLSGEDAGNLDRESVRRLTELLVREAGESTVAVRQLFAWLGSTTWPADAIGGDGQLVRHMLDEFDSNLISRSLHVLADRYEVMGAVTWAAFRVDDAAIVASIQPALMGVLADSQDR